MKEKPILFSGEMVRAILDGCKTQTRRVLKPEAFCADPRPVDPCPYGQTGDRLWVRETLQHGARNNPAPRHNHLWRYRADNALVMVANEHESDMRVWAHHKDGDICVSIHMPRWASRLTLEITNVRVERVQEISEDDARREGFNTDFRTATLSIDEFSELWDKINAKRGFGWDNNPWVWVIEFKKVTP